MRSAPKLTRCTVPSAGSAERQLCVGASSTLGVGGRFPVHQAIVDILNGAPLVWADIRGTQPWRLTLKGSPVDMALVATRSSDGWTLTVSDEMGRFDGPFVTGDGQPDQE